MEQETLDYIAKVELETGSSYPAKYASSVDNFIVALKAAGAWAGMDGVYLFRNHSAQAALINLKDPDAYEGTISGGVTFTQDVGLTGDGIDGLVSFPYRPDDGISQNYSYQDMSFGIKFLNPYPESTDERHGNRYAWLDRVGPRISMRSHTSSSGNTGPGAGNDADELVHVDRPTGILAEMFIGGSSVGTRSDSNTTNQSDTDFTIFNADGGGGFSSTYSSNTVDFVFFGASQHANAAAINTAILAYADDLANYVENPQITVTLNESPLENAFVKFFEMDAFTADGATTSTVFQNCAFLTGVFQTDANGVATLTTAPTEGKVVGAMVLLPDYDTEWQFVQVLRIGSNNIDLTAPA